MQDTGRVIRICLYVLDYVHTCSLYPQMQLSVVLKDSKASRVTPKIAKLFRLRNRWTSLLNG